MKRLIAVLTCMSGMALSEELPDKVEFQTHRVSNEYQNGEQEIRVILPDDYGTSGPKTYRVLYILPVEREFEDRYGDGLAAFAKLNAHNHFDLILVQPGFEKVPWFGDHATDSRVRQESHLKHAVVPLIEKNYRTTGNAEGRLLFGFSKSGWGAFSLILRDPDFWGYAAGWDSPMMLDRNVLSMEPVFGTQAQLDLFRPDLLVLSPERMAPFKKRTRIVLTGEKGWGVNKNHPAPGGGSHTVEFHQLLERNEIRHHYDNSLEFPHRWDPGWMEPTLDALVTLANGNEGS